jgi:integrase
LILPTRRGGRRWAISERRFLTRTQLGRLLGEIPLEHQPLLILLASTGLRISEAIALRWCDLELDSSPPRLQVRRAIVRGIAGAPKSYYGARAIPLAEELAGRLRALQPADAETKTSCSPTSAGDRSTPATSEIASSKALELKDLGVHERGT